MSSVMLGLVVLLAVAHIAARTLGLTHLAGALKALPIALLAAVTLGTGREGDASYRSLVGAALLASMGGDLFLLSRRRLVPGLFCFLTAHLIYICAFAPAAPLDVAAILLVVPFLGFALFMLRRLWPHLGRYRVPVGAYVFVITTMGWLATVRALGGEVAPDSGLTAMLGAFAFMVSDATLASDRFVRSFPSAQAVLMSTYYLAQILLTLSAVV